jgi:hypothetical protein
MPSRNHAPDGGRCSKRYRCGSEVERIAGRDPEEQRRRFTGGNLVAPVRLPGVAAYPVPPIGFVDALAWLPIGAGNQVQYLRQTGLPVAGAKTQVVEGDVKAEQIVNVALQTESILTVACWTSASNQALLDVPMLQLFLEMACFSPACVRESIGRRS